jgi:hypothetical protein
MFLIVHPVQAPDANDRPHIKEATTAAALRSCLFTKETSVLRAKDDRHLSASQITSRRPP